MHNCVSTLYGRLPGVGGEGGGELKKEGTLMIKSPLDGEVPAKSLFSELSISSEWGVPNLKKVGINKIATPPLPHFGNKNSMTPLP